MATKIKSTVQRSDMDELVFENRNRAYGAYMIRRGYSRVVVIASGISVVAFIFIFFLFSITEEEAPPPPPKLKVTKVDLTPPPPVNPNEPPPPPPPPPPPQLQELVKFTEPEVTEEEINEIPPIEKLETTQVGNTNQEGSGDEIIEALTEANVTVEEKEVEKIFDYAEEQPSYPGGEEALQKYLKENIRFPTMEKDMGKQGTVYISFIVDKNGKITNVSSAKDVPGAPGFTKEAIRVVNAMPPWTPGKMNGRSVTVKMNVPIRFTLK